MKIIIIVKFYKMKFLFKEREGFQRFSDPQHCGSNKKIKGTALWKIN